MPCVQRTAVTHSAVHYFIVDLIVLDYIVPQSVFSFARITCEVVCFDNDAPATTSTGAI